MSCIEIGADGLIPISLATLPVHNCVEVDIFIKLRNDQPAVLFCAAGQNVNRWTLQQHVAGGVTRLYIRSDDRQRYQQSLRESFQTLLLEEEQPAIERATIMHEVIRDVMSDQFSHGTTDSIVETCQLFGAQAARLMSAETIVLRELCRVLHHDYGTFTHSANVSAYSVMLAKGLGYSEADLTKIAIGGLLHDLGKLSVDEQILNKPGRLDDAERKAIEMHPALGLSRLTDRDDLCEGEMMMIYQHHERMDGSGYPVGVGRDEIHPWARICAVVDVFEALTSNRPYRQKLSAQTAMAILEKGDGQEFDKEMVACWRQLLQA